MPEPSKLPTGRRPYRMDRRRRSIDETRRRITAAAFDLHATVGPSRTTISAIAERAGVQRHTVYAHFPDLGSLFLACTRHGMQITGMPSPGPWTAVAEPMERMRLGLRELYAWYQANETMLRNVIHDDGAGQLAGEPSTTATHSPAREPDPFEERMAGLLEALVDGWPIDDPTRRRVHRAVVTHSLDFETWRSLTGAGLTDEQAIDLLVELARDVAAGRIGTVAP